MRNSVFCETTCNYVKLNDPTRLVVEPWPRQPVA